MWNIRAWSKFEPVCAKYSHLKLTLLKQINNIYETQKERLLYKNIVRYFSNHEQNNFILKQTLYER